MIGGNLVGIIAPVKGSHRQPSDQAIRSANLFRRDQLIPSSQGSARSGIWRKLAALVLVIAALGLPINTLLNYALFLIAVVVIFNSIVVRQPKAWLAAALLVILAGFAHHLLNGPKIEEGHNVFLPSNALVATLPSDVYRAMAEEFDRAYPPERHCSSAELGCWQGQGRPDQPYAFSADGIFDDPKFSRRVTDIDFSDPVWLRLGFINEVKYNWFSDASDLQRNTRQRSLLDLLHPWRLTMPFFVMYQFPAAYVGSGLCWQGEVLWEGPDRQFTTIRHDSMLCRTLESSDAGRRIFGLAIARDAHLAMTLQPIWPMRLRHLAAAVFPAIGVLAVLILLARCRLRRLALPFTFIALSLLVVLLIDASFIGGLRPFDGGDDGLFYDGVGRVILQHLLSGEFSQALEGGEMVFYYGGPGLRYLRALEHVVFGETYLGYLSLVLALPFVLFAAFRRFIAMRDALALTLIFIAIPIGALFGTCFLHYAKWAARGFADPAAATLFLSGLVVVIGPSPNGPDARFAPALGAGLLFALALFVRPNLAPGAAVLLGGAGIAALWQLQIRRLAGLCIGFLPVFAMALHNWYFGGVFVLFSANATIAEALPMPPSSYVAAFGELLRLNFSGEHLHGAVLQIARWLSGPSESSLMIPVHAAAIAVLVRVGFARGYDPWLRLIAWSALALHPVALFYLSYERYYYLTWLLTLLVCAVWMGEEGLGLLQRLFPRMAAWLEHHWSRARLGLDPLLAGRSG